MHPIIKPSEFTSASMVEFAPLFAEAGFPRGVVNVVTGLGPELGAALVEHPKVAHIGFTGGDTAGSKIYQAAAAGLKTVTLELGGKSPNIVFDDADLAQAVKGVVPGIFAASGQSCQAGSRLLLHESIHDAFVEQLVAFVRTARIGDPSLPDTQIGPISTRPQFEKTLAYIEIAKQEGARCVLSARTRPDLGAGWFIEPTIFTDVRNDMRIAQEEVFGPALAVIPFTDEDDAIRIGTSLVGIVRDFGMIDFPFSVSSGQQADALLDGPFGKALLATLPSKDLIGLVYWDLGFRNVTNSKRPITKVEDLSGLKLRVIPNPVFLETFKAFGANPVPMSFSELYTALEQKTVDGQENPYSVILSNKFYEVQKFVSGTNHVYAANIMLVSKKFWDTLTPTEQRIMQEAANEARDYERKMSREAASKAVGELTKSGMAFNEISPAQRDKMRAIVKPIIDKFSAEYDPNLVKLYNSELERVHKMN